MPIHPGGPMPPKPTDSESGSFPAGVHDRQMSQAVLGITVSADTSLTAKVTAGSPIFKVLNVTAYDLVLQAVDPTELPPSHHGAVFDWSEQNPVSSDGVAPLPVKQGQRVYLNVVVYVPLHVVPPGNFTGTVVLQGGGLTKTVALQGTYLGVDETSAIGQKWLEMGGEPTFGNVLSNENAALDQKGTVQEFANGALYELPLPKVPVGPSSAPVSVSLLAAESTSNASIPVNVSPKVPRTTKLATQSAVAMRAPVDAGPRAGKEALIPAGLRTEVHYFSPAVYAKWTSLATATGSAGGPVWNALGFPKEDTFTTAEGGQALRFQGGAIVVRNSQQAFVVYGAIYAHYAQLGNLSDPNRQPAVGLPISDEQAALSNRGRLSRFDFGDVYWDSNVGAHEVHGDIRQHWSDLGGAGGFLGFPLTDETGTTDGVGRYNRFEGGVIFWTPNTGPHEVHGAILDRWSSLGLERSYLGYPTSDEGNGSLPYPLSVPGRVSSFQFGKIGWTSQTGAFESPDSVTKSQQVLTPAGTALGGTVTFTLWSNGNYAVQFHMHDSGLPDYDFQARAIFTTSTGLNLVAAHDGHVEGTVSTTLSHAPYRDDDHNESGHNPFIQLHWSDIQNGTLWVTKDYSATGVVGFFEDLAKAILDVGAAAAGGALGLVIGIGSEVGKLFGDLGLGGAFGVIAGVVVFAFTGNVALATLAGVAVGAVTNSMINQRPISQAEYDMANGVFSGSLPPRDQIVLTDLSGIGGRAFTMPGVDGKIYVNLGDAYNDPVNYTKNGAYPTTGQLLVHELTHAWQIYHATFLPGFVCAGIVNQANYNVGQSVYTYGPPGPGWGDFNLEAQGAMVDQWFGGTPTVVAPYRKAMDPSDPYFGYIANNIRTGTT